jgi:hypothetical protein
MTRSMTMLCLALAACGGDKDDTTGDTGPTGTTGTPPSADLVFTDANNYTFESDLQISAVEVAPETDLLIDWSGVTTDIRGRSVDPTQVEQILFVEFGATQAEVLTKIDANDLQQSDALNQYLYFNNGQTSIQASDLSILGNPFDLELLKPESSKTWLLSLTNIVDSRFDFLMNTFVVPTEGSKNTMVVLDDSSATLTFEVDLQSAPALRTSSSFDEYTLDWSAATKDVFGRDLDVGLVTRLIIGKVATDDISAVEADFLQLYELADELYTQDVNGLTFANLSGATLQSDGTTPFAGFTADGTWVVGIECTRQECTNPAPLLLSVVEVVD